jgi:hypothetical protein
MTKTRKDFQQLAAMRAKEAQALVKSGNQNGAYYLGAIRNRVCTQGVHRQEDKEARFPADRSYATSVYTHDLTQLLKVAALQPELEREMRTNIRLATNWGVVKTWNVESGYEISPLNGTDMIAAVNSPRDGVLK